MKQINIGKVEDGIFHAIAVVGEPQQKLLYAYVEFFDYYHVIVLLNDNYDGEEFRNVYCYNLLKKCESEAFFESFVTREMIFDFLSKELIDYGELLVRKLQSTVRQIEIKNSADKVWNEIVSEYQELYTDGIPTEIFIKVFSEKMAKEFTPYIRKASNIKREKHME